MSELTYNGWMLVRAISFAMVLAGGLHLSTGVVGIWRSKGGTTFSIYRDGSFAFEGKYRGGRRAWSDGTYTYGPKLRLVFKHFDGRRYKVHAETVSAVTLSGDTMTLRCETNHAPPDVWRRVGSVKH